MHVKQHTRKFVQVHQSSSKYVQPTEVSDSIASGSILDQWNNIET